MQWPIFVLLSQMVQSVAHGHTHFRTPSHSALALAKACQCQNLEFFDDDEAHEMAFKLHDQGKRATRGFRHVLSIVDKKYVRYLQRISAAKLGKDNVRKLIGETTREYVRDYIMNPRPADMIRGIQKAHRMKTKENLGSDIVRQEYYNGAMLARETYFQTLFVYEEYVLFPHDSLNDSVPACLKILKNYIATRMVEFDFGATYPDTVICLSLLQFLKYVALFNGEWDQAMDASKQYKSALTALKNMQFHPKITYTHEEHKLKVCLMPQARKGAKPIPMSIDWLEDDTRMVQISILDVSDPNDPELVFKELKQMNANICS